MHTPVALVAPFALLLLGIAILPLVAPHAWERNGTKAIVVALLAIPAAAALALDAPAQLLHAGEEYISFLTLLGSLYVIAGGIVVRGDFRPTPLANAGVLGAGAVLANLIGTTGASMLLIRPFLRANRVRSKTRHLPLFFIFIVSNAGGLLTPLGDPPLFMGFLRGVPFEWTLRLWPVWLFVNGTLIALFAYLDWRSNLGEGEFPDPARSPLRFAGLHNLAFLAAVVTSAALVPFGPREVIMATVALASAKTTTLSLRQENGFTYGPIVEVAILFAGIFVTMQPALSLIREIGPSLGLGTAREFFAVSGVLSSVLDNAPTYVTFFTLAQSLAAAAPATATDLVGTTGVPAAILAALSLGSVLMGANTYVGNGPNFMVKAICDEAGFKTPSFFGYMGLAALILGPVWLVVAFGFV